MSQNPFSQDEDELPVASLVDNMYRIVRLIGRGGMGAVYEAEDIRLGRPVALKVLRSDLAKQLQADERFMQEARILARIRSPFVCTVYSIGATESGKTYIAMEYIDGGSVGDLLDRERWLPLRRAIRVAQRVCEALIEAHEAGIIHRDLKPDNILLTRVGSMEDYVKVVDLGLAKHIASAGSNNPRLTQARLVLGTPAYMSPEQAAGQDVGPQSDLYSLGVIFYEMLTGYLPVDGETPQDFLRAHQLQPPVPLATRRPDLEFPPLAETICSRILTKRPEERPVGAHELIEMLQELETELTTQRSSVAPANRRDSRIIAPPAKPPEAARDIVAPTIEQLDERLERAKDRVRLELVGLAAPGRAGLYETLDAYVRHANSRVEAPAVVRVRVPPPEGRVPLSCLFDEVRARAGVFDDDPPALGRRKLLGWAQGLMPERPGRASQIAHLAGMFLDVDFPDSPHLSHAKAVPEVARMAGGSALADVLRALAGRGALVFVLERVEFLTSSELGFLRRLVRQLGATPVLVVAGWVGDDNAVPDGLQGTIATGSVMTVPARPESNVSMSPGAEEVLQAAVQLGTPIWPGMLDAAMGRPCHEDINRLVSAGALRSSSQSRFNHQEEYMFGDFRRDFFVSAAHLPVDVDAALAWLTDRTQERSRLWAQRLARLETRAGYLKDAVAHARVAGSTMFALGALSEASAAFELAREICLDLRENREVDASVQGLALTARSAVGCLRAQGRSETLSERAHEAIEALRSLSTLDEAAWYRLGAPLLSAWAGAETDLGRAADTIAPLRQQIDAIGHSRLEVAVAHLPKLRRAMGDALRAGGEIHRALEQWLAALRDLPLEPDFPLMADLSIRISDAYRDIDDGARAVLHARKALTSARLARDLVRESEALRTLAVGLRDVGELDDAEAQLGEALNALGRVDRPRLAAEVSVLLARVLMQRGAIDEADAALAKACRSFAALTDLTGLADALRQRGEIQMAQGTYARALAFAEESARQAVLAGAIGLQVRALLLAARGAAASGDYGHAHTALANAFELVSPTAATLERAESLITLADLLEADVLTSDRDVASLLTETAEIYEAAGSPHEAEAVRRRVRAMNGN
ncbi:MAG: protein kinase [Myxococcales bacterium]|nr:protein kinase [Myxococcales bacterium]